MFSSISVMRSFLIKSGLYHLVGTACRDTVYNLHKLLYAYAHCTGGAQPPQVTGSELALVSDEASRAGSASPPGKRVHHSPPKVLK